MSGTAHGRLDCRQATGIVPIEFASRVFVSLVKAVQILDAANRVDLVATNWGNGSGFDYPGGAAPIGTSGFVVFKLPPTEGRVYSLYCLIQYCSSSALGTSNNALLNSAAFSGYGGIGITFAAALDSGGADANPWGGGTDVDGADAKSNPAWIRPAGGALWMGNRTNAIDDGVNKLTGADLHKLFSFSSSNPATSRWGIQVDADNIGVYFDHGDVGKVMYIAAVRIEPNAAYSAASPIRHCAIRYDQTNDLVWNQVVKGTVAGTDAFEISAAFAADGDAKLGGLWLGASSRSQLQPSSLAVYNEGIPEVFVEEAAFVGVLGTTDPFLGYVSNLATYNTLELPGDPVVPKARVVLGYSTLAYAKLTAPWDGTTTPQGAGATNDGVDF